MSEHLQVGSIVEPLRENVVCRTQEHDFLFVHPEQHLTVKAVGCGLLICDHPEMGIPVTLQAEDVKPAKP